MYLARKGVILEWREGRTQSKKCSWIRDGSVLKDTCHQGWESEFELWPTWWKRELTATSCPLTSIYNHSTNIREYMHHHMYTYVHKINKWRVVPIYNCMKGSPETRAWNNFDKGKSAKVASNRVVTLIPKAQRSMIRKSPKREITQHLSPRLLPISLFFHLS